MHAEGLSAALPLHRVLTLGKIAEGWGEISPAIVFWGIGEPCGGEREGGAAPTMHSAFGLGLCPDGDCKIPLIWLSTQQSALPHSHSLSLSAKSDLILNAKGGGKGQEGTWAGWHRKGYRTEY